MVLSFTPVGGKDNDTGYPGMDWVCIHCIGQGTGVSCPSNSEPFSTRFVLECPSRLILLKWLFSSSDRTASAGDAAKFANLEMITVPYSD
eukprot:1249535-Rhodomonas_salina.2